VTPGDALPPRPFGGAGAPALETGPRPERVDVRIRGVVQGVGFRPFVYSLARRLGVTGRVWNDHEGVGIEAEGPPESLAAFVDGLKADPPPLAVIQSVEVERGEVTGLTSFCIVDSLDGRGRRTLVSPDIAPCARCLEEMWDPSDRRYRYPFINCTHCGPRFTIIQALPYDRPRTTMSDFPMCEACRKEYEDPGDRRYHAQPVACPECGPTLAFHAPDGAEPGASCDGRSPLAHADRALARAVESLARGSIVAIKGLGGYHLACDALEPEVVAELRRRKHRPHRPLAVMVSTLEEARRLASMSPREEALLAGRERPVVLARRRPDAGIPRQVAPDNAYVGLMLPSTPLHELLLADWRARSAPERPAPLVMTSGNPSGEPTLRTEEEAFARLRGIADAFLAHDRRIHVRVDDSVVRVRGGIGFPLRRARGWAPLPVPLPFPVPPSLAVGGELKNVVCLAEGTEAFLGPHLGDMENLETLRAFEETVDHLQRIFRTSPERIVCDLHPRYLSTRWARERGGIGVQHHHAHATSLMAEHGLPRDARVLAFVFDGTGFGTDGAVWGGEVLATRYDGFQRVAHLAYVPLPGGNASVLKPYRMALAHLHAAEEPWREGLAPVARCPELERQAVLHQLETGLNAVPTSSMGRLFDAVASILGVRHEISYEGQAAIELEHRADAWARAAGRSSVEGYRFGLVDREDGPLVIDPSPVIRDLVEDVRAGRPAGECAAAFLEAIARMTVEVTGRLVERPGEMSVGFSGGVFQNSTLTERVVSLHRELGRDPLLHHLVPPNDGGLALGQIVAGTSAD
jgi:hydrogenase maturation protein HypF